MMNLDGFNANEVEPNEGFDPLPVGQYEVVISASEEKENSKKTGSYLKLEFTVISGEYENRKLWTNLNLKHPDSDTVRRAKGELSAICRAVGVMQPKGSPDLHDIPLVIKVGIKKREDTGEPSNVVRGYIAKEQTTATNGTKKAAPSSGQAPWARK